MVPPVKDVAWLEWMNQLWGASAQSTPESMLPRSSFYCLLDSQPDHLLPGHCLQKIQEKVLPGEDWFINPGCYFACAGELPPICTAGLESIEQFAMQSNIVWVRDPNLQAWWPFWLGKEYAALLEGVSPGTPAPGSFPLQQIRILATAGILLNAESETDQFLWKHAFARSTSQFSERGFTSFRGLIHPFLVAALRRYFRHQIRINKMELGDSQSARRYVVHNEPVARYFHHQLTSAVSAIVGETVKPSYVYAASYQEGAKLERHTDREQCEYSITFCLDFSPEPEQFSPWPIHLDTPKGKITVFQGIGDGLIYRGRQLPHYRDPLPKGSTSTSIFFHYVSESFVGTLD